MIHKIPKESLKIKQPLLTNRKGCFKYLIYCFYFIVAASFKAW